MRTGRGGRRAKEDELQKEEGNRGKRRATERGGLGMRGEAIERGGKGGEKIWG